MSRYINNQDSYFNYAAKVALDAAALVHREAGRNCQCGHLMHAGRCAESNATQSTPSATVRYWCQCQNARIADEPQPCAMSGCSNVTRLIDGKGTVICFECHGKREALIQRGNASFTRRGRR